MCPRFTAVSTVAWPCWLAISFAQSSWHLANLDDLEVVKLLSRVIMDLAEGEIRQGLFRYDTGQSLETYLEKSYWKTASLIANSAKAAGVLSELSVISSTSCIALAVNWVWPSRSLTTSSISPVATISSVSQLPLIWPLEPSPLL